MIRHSFPYATEHRLTLPELASALQADHLLSAKEVDQLLNRIRNPEGIEIHPLVIIANQKFKSAKPPHPLLTLDILTQWLSNWANLPYLAIEPLKIDIATIATIIPQAYAMRFKILPIDANPESITIATAEPFIYEWVNELEQALKRKIARVIASPIDINRYLNEFYGVSRTIKKANTHQENSQSNNIITQIGNLEQLVELKELAQNSESNDQHLVQIVDWLLQYAFAQKASDIHLEQRRKQGHIRLRIDGVLHLVSHLPSAVMQGVIHRLKILGRMDVAERRRPQDGRIKTRSPQGEEIELRLSTLPTAFGEKLVARIFHPEVTAKNFLDLGLSSMSASIWEEMIQQPYGLILVTGPTGSGKTTTLYATLKRLATPEVNVCTIEDPIEMIEPSCNQMQVQNNIDLTFASGIRTLLRQDPDIIMIGEIRDREAAEMAIQAALTGHLVLSTLHTNDAASAVSRLIDIGVAPYLIRATLLGVLAQRLVRKLCSYCKQKVPTDAETWNTLVSPWQYPIPESTYFASGCPQCRNTGYSGRRGIYEIIRFDSKLLPLIKQETSGQTIREKAHKQHGMEPLRIDGARKIAEGITTFSEIARVVPTQDEM